MNHSGRRVFVFVVINVLVLWTVNFSFAGQQITAQDSQIGNRTKYLPFLLLLLEDTTGGAETYYSLTVNKAGTGIGTVNTNTGSLIWSGSTGTAMYQAGTPVILTATATSGSTFAGWSGACAGTGTCSVTLSGAKSVTATFNGSSSVPGMVSVPAGCFLMSTSPLYEVCLSTFLIDAYEVTQGEYRSVTGSNPSYQPGNDALPVNQVNWSEAGSYCQAVGKRLPTEAEWEYAARSGGQAQKWAGTNIEAELVNYAWYSANALATIHPAGTKTPNGLGLYDMSGNVGEWVNDWYSATDRVIRGGSRSDSARNTMTSHRNYRAPDTRASNLGFRCAVTQ